MALEAVIQPEARGQLSFQPAHTAELSSSFPVPPQSSLTASTRAGLAGPKVPPPGGNVSLFITQQWC